MERVHILDGRDEGVILKETFSNLGSGTMVYSNRYGGIRPMTLKDISDVLRIMQPIRGARHPSAPHRGAAGGGTGRTSSCSRWTTPCMPAPRCTSSPRRTGEIAGIAVDEHYLHLGVGPKLVDFLCERARRKGLSSVFALTTQTADWFQKLGFEEADPSVLPEKKRLSYNLQRKSRVFLKSLGTA